MTHINNSTEKMTMNERFGDVAPNLQPWKVLNHHDAADAAVTWGYASEWPATTTNNYLDSSNMLTDEDLVSERLKDW